jgi:hypothetical protein
VIELKYFVLRPRSEQRHDVYARAARKAMRMYAKAIYSHDSQLAYDLTTWADNEFRQALTCGFEDITSDE